MDCDIRGERKKVCVFNCDKAEDRALFLFAHSINFSQFVRECLRAEYQRRTVPPRTVQLRTEPRGQ